MIRIYTPDGTLWAAAPTEAKVKSMIGIAQHQDLQNFCRIRGCLYVKASKE